MVILGFAGIQMLFRLVGVEMVFDVKSCLRVVCGDKVNTLPHHVNNVGGIVYGPDIHDYAEVVGFLDPSQVVAEQPYFIV